MFLLNKTEHALVTVFADTPKDQIARAISTHIPDKDLRILTPTDPNILGQAAQNSVLAFIGIKSAADENLGLIKSLKENRLVVCDVIAINHGSNKNIAPIDIMTLGFDAYLHLEETEQPQFRKILMHRITIGSRRLAGLITEEEYRRICDALSNAPASIMIFDNDKRAVFISDHYFRAYPRIASRLVRGLSVYDAFDMMAKEEGLAHDDPLYERLQKYWYNLEGSIEFTLSTKVSYRLKAVQLPSRRGTVIMAQNISGYENARSMLEEQTALLRAELEKLMMREEA